MSPRLVWPAQLGLVLATFCGLALFGRAELGSIDELMVHRTTQSLTRGAGWEIVWQAEEQGERRTSRHSLAASLWGAPFCAAADQLPPSMERRDQWRLYVTQLSSALAVALTSLLLAGWLVRLGHSERAAVACALLYTFGTIAFPYASTSFSQVLATLALLVCCRAAAADRPLGTLLAFAGAIACQPNFVALGPALCLAWDWKPRCGWWWRRIGMVAGGAVAGLSLNALVNWGRGDSLLWGDYGREAFTTPLWVGLGGLAISFGKGLAWYSPLAAAGLAGTVWYAVRRPAPGLLVLAVAGSHLLVIAKWWCWHGGLTWGPRLLLPILPLCFLPVAAWLDEKKRQPLSARWTFFGLAGAGVLVNLWAASQPRTAFFDALHLLPTLETETVFIPQTSPFGVGWQPPLPFLWRPEQWPAAAPWVSGFIVGVAVGYGLFVQGLRRREATTRPPMADATPGSLPLAKLLAAGAIFWLACGPWLADALAIGGDAPPEYQDLLSSDGGKQYRGTLSIPVAGTYTFYCDPRRPLDVEIDRHTFEPLATAISLQIGEYPIRLRRSQRPGPWQDQPIGTLRWTIPGAGMYKQPVPRDYLHSSPPTQWQRARLWWRHHLWIAWVLAFVVGAAGLVGAGSSPPRTGEEAHPTLGMEPRR